MLDFDILFVVNILIALVALIRVRGATFILIANVCSILRALSAIGDFGQPRSQRFLPPAVFDPSRLATALNIFTVVTLLGLIAVALPRPRQTTAGDLPAPSKWVIRGLGLYFIALAFSKKTILSSAYAQTSQDNFDIPQGGLVTCLQGLVIYELYRRVCAGRLTTGRAFALLMGFLVITDYSKGSTGVATGFVFMAAFLFFGREGSQWMRPVKVGAALVAITTFAIVLRAARATMYTQGVASLDTASQALLNTEESRSQGAEGIEANANAAQYAAHVLECVYLYDSGYSREWRSLYDPIVYTFQPKFIMDILGLQRSIEPAIELGGYFIHGGGIAIFGEMYWNGGYLCVWITSALIFWLAYLADTFKERSFGWLIFYCLFASGMLIGVGYGLTYLFRGAANALLVTGVYKLFSKKGRVRSVDTHRNIAEEGSGLRAVLPAGMRSSERT